MKQTVILTVAEVAERLGVHVRTVSRLFARGEFPNSRKMGSGRVSNLAILLSDVEAYEKKLAALPKSSDASHLS